MSILKKYIPEVAVPQIEDWLKQHYLQLRISKSRSSKFGDFRPSQGRQPARISVNYDLNPYHFLVTVVHEIAHAAVWEKYGRKASPHGKRWQEAYRNYMREVIALEAFPSEILPALEKHISRPKASSCSDPQLMRELRRFDPPSDYVFLEELEDAAFFETKNGRQFEKGNKRRTRFLCKDLSNGRMYLVSGQAEVKKLDR